MSLVHIRSAARHHMELIKAEGLLDGSEFDALDAVEEFIAAQAEADAAQMMNYEVRETERGDTIHVPLKRLMEEIIMTSDIPDSAMPGGRGGDAKERQKCRENWCYAHNKTYKQYVQTLEDAEYRMSMAQGALAVAERKTARANAKFGAAKAAFEFMTAQTQAQTMTDSIRLARIQRGSEDVERGISDLPQRVGYVIEGTK